MIVIHKEQKTARSAVVLLLLVLLAACGAGATPGANTASDAVSSAASGSPTATIATQATPTGEQTTATAPAEAAAPAGTGTSAAAGTAEKLNVVATYSILGDLVHNVGGNRIVLTTLVGRDGDPHVYEPTPQDTVILSEAAIVFENGLGFETWIDDLYTSSGSQARRVVVTEQIEPLSVEEGHGHSEADATVETDEHEHGEVDPHVWNDPNNAITMVEAIRDALVAADPANAATYRTNADTYLAQLKELDTYIKTETQQLPPERRKLVTAHDTFGYFARRYGYEIVGTALGSVTTEATDPSAGEIAELVEEIKAAGVPAIFAESSNNPALIKRIAQEAGVELAPTLYPEALSEPGGEADTYLKLVRYNVSTIVEALGQDDA
jgi:ABC-type Zn uptake system ZnuABC Zn-binding protein ZnuA